MSFPLSSDPSELKERWNVVVIGSGYGGSILSARLAQAGVSDVCVLERGKEWLPGDFPDTFETVGDNFRVGNLPTNRLGLFDYLVTRDIDVLRGNGLGGTSLINANVAIRPDRELYEMSHWPSEIRDLVTSGVIWDYYQRAEATLRIAPHPRAEGLAKVQAMKKCAAQLSDHEFQVLKLAVNHDVDGLNHCGVEQKPCIDCGDCFSGCNVGAKNTLNFNYLPLARNAGVKIFARIEISHLKANPDGTYSVHYNVNNPRGQGPEKVLTANRVILGAGALGSTEILLRSQEEGLKVSASLGSHFSGNGDFVAVAYNNRDLTDVMGFGNHPDGERAGVRPGPSIVSGIRFHRSESFSRRYILEDFSFPSALVDVARRAFPFVAGRDTDAGFIDRALELQRMGMDLVSWNPQGALNRTMVYLCMGVDDSSGQMRLNHHGKLTIDWEGVANKKIFHEMNEEIERHATTLGGTFIENFRWTFLGGRNLITVHPLGGCRMAADGDEGVVDARGRVYDGDGDVHRGLHVVDGAILPSAVGVNPFLTISALAEWIAEKTAEDILA